jgi:DNA-directed RNA polymerase subunit L
LKITVLKQEQNQIDFLIEREQGTYNNVNVSAIFTDEEISGFSENQVKTLAYNKVKDIAIRVFEQIEPLDEVDNPVDFSLVELPVVEQTPVVVADMPSQIEVEFAEYVIATEDRIAELENKINTLTGGN